MALWPFRRKGGRKRTRSGANLSDVETTQPRGLGIATDDALAATAAMPKKQRLDQQQQQQQQQQHHHNYNYNHNHNRPPPSDSDGNLPHPRSTRTRTYSFSPGRNDSIRVAGQKGSGPPVPGRWAGAFPADRNDGEQKGDPSWQRAPTLHVHNARHGQKKGSSSRRKSSKRRKQESDRAAEIKAMTNFEPYRPAADDWTSGRPIRKQSKRVKTGLGFRRSFEGPASDVSLPISIHSSMSSESEMHSFRVSALEALAPRPTLRYTVCPRWGPGQSSAGQPRPQQKRKVSERVPESVVRAHTRVNSFADDLDAADLRELMERDNKRRERRRQRDQERIEKRLARRAEKQREAEVEARRSGSPPPVNMERGVMGREMVGFGIDGTSAVVTSNKRRSSSSLHRPSTDDLAPQAEPELETEPMDIESELQRTSSIQPDVPISLPPPPPPPLPEASEPMVTPKKSMRLRRSFLRSKKSRSRSPNVSDEEQHPHAVSPLSSRQDQTETSRKTSDSSGRARLSFAALFRWGKRKRRNSGPSSFSNTSREEMQAAAAYAQAQAQAQNQTQNQNNSQNYISHSRAPPADENAVQAPSSEAVPPPTNYIPRKVSSGVPKRTRSRFREDLPELPLSPPDSQVGSPEADEPPMPVVSEVLAANNLSSAAAVVRHDTPTSEIRRVDEKMEKLEKMRQTPTSMRHSIQPSPDQPQSVSLASIDSEGSWLSGRISKQRSSGVRTSMQRFHAQHRTQSPSPNDTEEELADDEYLSNLATPSREVLADERTPRKSTGDAFPSSDEDELMEEADMKWGSVERQRATPVVQHQRIKSREVMLNAAIGDEDTSAENSEEGETPQLQRATSVSLSNARHVSSGSTKMLEVSPRTSVEHRRTGDAIY